MENQRLNLLDGLRGLAAFVIVVHHYKYFFLALPGDSSLAERHAAEMAGPLLRFFFDHGFRAVEFFWLVSGFVFTYVYCFGKQATTREFVVNRFARLYPLHLLTLIVVALLQVAALHQFGRYLFFIDNDAYRFVLNLFLVSAWGFDHGFSFNSPIWSVSVEIAIYVLFWALHGKLVRWGPLGAVAVAAICGFIVLCGPPTFIFACGYFFFWGVALALLHPMIAQRRHMPSLLVAGLLAAGAAALVSGNELLTVAVGLPALYGAIVVLAVELEGSMSARLRDAAQWLGDRSYGIYLWHFPLMIAFTIVLMPLYDFGALLTQHWVLALHCIAVLAAAHVSYVGFERPARQRLRQLARRPWRSGMRHVEIKG